MQTWIASFSLAKLNDITDGIKDMASGINLTTELEGTMTANIKATKTLGANFGYTGAAAKKFAGAAASMAYGLNVSTEIAGSATYAMDQYSDVLKAVGIDSKQTAAKVQEVFGIDMGKFGGQLKGLRKEFGFSDKQLSNLVGGMQVFGQQSGDVKGAMEKLPELIEMVRKQATSLGKTMGADELADYATQTTELAAGFYTFTNDSETAQKQAMAISNALIEANVNIGKMFAGTEQDLGKFAQNLGIATGDIDKSFKLMKKGPSGFVKGLGGMIADMGGFSKMTAEQANFIQKQLVEAMGPDAGQMVFEFFQKADASTLKAMASVKDATSSIGKLGKEAFSTGLTLQDSFDRAKQSFVVNFRAIARKEAVAFVKDTTSEFGKFNKSISATAAEGGPLGAVISKFSEMHQIGGLALLPKTLRPMAAVFGTMLQEATPLIGALGSLGLRFSHLTNPLTLAVVGIGGLALAMKAAEKNTRAQIETTAKSRGGIDKMAKSIAALEGKQRKATVGSAEWNQLNKTIVQKKWMLEQSKQMRAAGDDAQKLSAIHQAISDHERKRSIEQVKDLTKKVLDKIKIFFQALPSIISGVAQTLREMWPEIGPPILDGLKAAFHWVVSTAGPAIFDFAKGLWDGLIYGANAQQDTAAGRVGVAIGETLNKAFAFALKHVWSYLKKWWGKMGDIWGDNSTSFTDKVKATFSNSAGLIIGAFAIAKFTPIFGIFKTLLPLVMGVGKALIGLAFSVLKTVVPAVASLAWTLATRVIPAVLSLAYQIGATLIPALFSFAAAMARTAIMMVLTNPLLAAGVAVGALVAYLSSNGPSITDMFDQWRKKTADNNKELINAKAIVQSTIKGIAESVRITKDAVNSVQTDTARAVTGTMATVRQEGKTAFVEVTNAADLAMLSTKKMSDNLALSLKSNVTLVDKQARVINSIVFPKFDNENHKEVMKLIGEWRKLNSEGQGGHDVTEDRAKEIVNRMSEISQQMRQTYGTNVMQTEALIDLQAKQFSVRADLVKSMGLQERLAYQSRLDMVFDGFLQEQKMIRAAGAAKVISQQEMNAQLAESQRRAQEMKSQMENALQSVQFGWQVALQGASTDANKLLAVAGAAADKFEAITVTMMGNLNTQIAESAKEASRALSSAMLAELNQIAKLEGIDAAQRTARTVEIQTKYQALQTDLVNKSKEANALMVQNANLNKDAALNMLADFSEKAKKLATDTAGQTNAVIGSMQHELGISNADALQSLQAVATIDPRKFEANLKKLKKTFIEFTKEIATAFKDAWDSALKSTQLAMLVIDQNLTFAMVRLRGLMSLLDIRFESERQKREQTRQKDIRAMSESDRDQELLNATNWPLWYDDYRVQFASLVTAVSSLSGQGAKGGRTTPRGVAVSTSTAAPNGTTRGAR